MTRLFIGVASNHEAERYVPEAMHQLAKVARIVAISSFHQTPAIDRPQDPPYTNGVIAVETTLRPTVVRRKLLKSIEDALGRARSPNPFGPRTIDLDLLLEWVQRPHGRSPRPHPDVLDRHFVASALLEVAGDIRLASPAGNLSDHVASLAKTPMVPLPELTRHLRTRFLERPHDSTQTFARTGMLSGSEPQRLGHSIQEWAQAAAQRHA